MAKHTYPNPIKEMIPRSRLMNTGCVFESLTMALKPIRKIVTTVVRERSHQPVTSKFHWNIALPVGLTNWLRNNSSMRAIFVAWLDVISALIAATTNCGVPSNKASNLCPRHLDLGEYLLTEFNQADWVAYAVSIPAASWSFSSSTAMSRMTNF